MGREMCKGGYGRGGDAPLLDDTKWITAKLSRNQIHLLHQRHATNSMEATNNKHITPHNSIIYSKMRLHCWLQHPNRKNRIQEIQFSAQKLKEINPNRVTFADFFLVVSISVKRQKRPIRFSRINSLVIDLACWLVLVWWRAWVGPLVGGCLGISTILQYFQMKYFWPKNIPKLNL